MLIRHLNIVLNVVEISQPDNLVNLNMGTI